MFQLDEFEMKGLRLVLTCGACPEQYDVFDKTRNVAYLRLRHGRFYAECPDTGGEEVYSARPDGDGIFEDEEREHYLSEALDAVREWMERNP